MGVEIAKTQSPGIPIHCFRFEVDPLKLTQAHGFFDAVIFLEVVGHLYSLYFLPQLVWHCIKPGGFLVVSTPYHGYLKNIALSLAGKLDHHHTALWHGGHIEFWSRVTLSKVLVQLGLLLGRASGLWPAALFVEKYDFDFA